MRQSSIAIAGILTIATSAPAQIERPADPRTARLAIFVAEDRRAPTPKDLSVIRAGLQSADGQTVLVAVRALGRLERPSLIPDIVPALRNALPEVRSEAANAIGQALEQSSRPNSDRTAASQGALDGAVSALSARLKVEAEPDVRSAICETIGRLPYTKPEQAEEAERTLIEAASRGESTSDRLGVAKGFESLVRLHRTLRRPGDEALTLLRRLASASAADVTTGVRVRRLALGALIDAGAVDDRLLAEAIRDRDLQVRRLAVHATATANAGVTAGAANDALEIGRHDSSFMVRLESLDALRARADVNLCALSLTATGDQDVHVALRAFDLLAGCGSAPDAVAALDRTVHDLGQAGSPRGWHRAAHALVALAAASPELGAKALPQFTGSSIWQLRMYAGRAAVLLTARAELEALAADPEDNVREVAIDGLRKTVGHDADSVYVSELSRTGYQVLRSAALALDGTPHPETAIPALRASLQRLVTEGRDNSHDARDAMVHTLEDLGESSSLHKMVNQPKPQPGNTALNTEDLRRLASPRARVTIRGVGRFDLALFTAQAPATVLRFARLAESGYYNGLTFHRVVPNFVIQGGSPGANELIGDAFFMRDELGLWPHVRGAVGISTRGRDTGDAQIFVDLVDNPRLDHEYTVFAQVLSGIDVVDQILEGDAIESVEILKGP
jgi:cyclophilin family peptidyl-prolyl cis-trans isomerase